MAADKQLIDYEVLLQAAMRGMVRSVLQQVVKTGLPGEHHFYIAFNTQAPGVTISKRLKEKYPQEMTIVLQHRFWDLLVQDDRFEVKLTFDAIPERLVVPFAAIKVFWDPSVPYGHQFEDSELVNEASRRMAEGPGGRKMTGDAEAARQRGPGRVGEKKRPAQPRRAKPDGMAGISTEDVVPSALGEGPPESPVASDQSTGEPPIAVAVPEKGKVISLDKFRKK